MKIIIYNNLSFVLLKTRWIYKESKNLKKRDHQIEQVNNDDRKEIQGNVW